MGALLARRTDERWIVATRRWTLVAWTCARHRPAARRALGLRRGRLGRLLRLGPGRERGADAVARRDRVPALGDDPGEARDAEGLERAPRRARVLPLALRHVPHPLAAIVSSIHSFTQSSIGPWFLGFICLVVARLARARSSRACRCCARRRGSSRSSRARRRSSTTTCCSSRSPDDPLGRRLSDPVRGRARRAAVTSGAPYYNFFLRVFGLPLLLLMGIGPLVAWRRASLRGARPDVRSGRAASRSRQAPSCSLLGAGLVDPGPGRVHVLGLRARVDRARVRARHAGAAGARRAARGRRVLGARRAQPAPLRRLRRPRGDRPARDRRSPARAPTTPSRERKLAPGETIAVGDYRLTFRGSASGAGRERDRGARASSTSTAAATTSGTLAGRARTRTPPSSRSRTRSGSAATCSRARTCS